MNGAHDPHADPLTPDWRKKVDAAASGAFIARALPPVVDLSQLSDRDQRIAAGWRAGVPALAIATALRKPTSTVWSRVYWMQERGVALERRPRRSWRPPDDWQQRLAEIAA